MNDILFIALVPTSYAFFLSWLIMSDSKAEDIKSVYRWLTRSKARD